MPKFHRTQSRQLRRLIVNYIAGEDKDYPLSDAEIATLLLQHGFAVTSCTVGYHRRNSGYGRSSERKVSNGNQATAIKCN